MESKENDDRYVKVNQVVFKNFEYSYINKISHELRIIMRIPIQHSLI